MGRVSKDMRRPNKANAADVEDSAANLRRWAYQERRPNGGPKRATINKED